jgi:hypothetical protein
METKDWVFLALNVIGLYLAGKQNQLQARALNREPTTAGKRLSFSFKRFWPMAVMVLLLAGAWVPYFLGKVAASPLTEPPVGMTAWALEQPIASPIPDADFAVVGGTQFAAKYANQYNVLIFTRVVDDTIDANSDRVIDRSNSFQIPVGGAVKIEVPFSPPASSRFSTPRMVSTYLVIIPKKVDPLELTTLNSISTHGGYILGIGQQNSH